MSASHTLRQPDWLDSAARSYPDKLALSFGSDSWTFAALREATAAAAPLLITTPAAAPGRVGILSANRPGFVLAIHAARRAGRSIVPLNWRQTSGELRWQVRDARVTQLVADEPRMAVAAEAIAGLPVALTPMAALEAASRITAFPEPAPPIDLPREAAVIYTSGTTGRPKGARLSYSNTWFSAIGSALRLGHHHDDVWLAALPLFHVGGLSIVMRSVIGAAPVVLQDRFDPGCAFSALETGVTLASVVPTMLQRLLDHHGDRPWPPQLRCLLVGGSAAPPGLIAECIRRRIPVAPTYGLTESASQATTLLPGEAARKPGSVGLPLPLVEVRVTAAGRAVASGSVGEIELRGPTLFMGYVGHDLEGGRPDNDPWFNTGDLGYLDDDGYLFVVDRRDDLIVSGGENIYPAEIERVLLEHPLVRDAAVVGLKEATWGARHVAAVVWTGDSATAAPDLLAHCRLRLASFKIPERILLFDELPRSASGKLIRRALREPIERQLRQGQ